MKVTEKIHLLKIDFEITVSPGKTLSRFVNVVIIFGREITLIDTGVKGSEEKIFRYIAENGRDSSELSRIILSHSHPDHIGSARALKEMTGCRIMAHRGERSWIENIEEQNRQRPVPGFFSLVDSPVSIDDLIEGGQVIMADDDISMEAIHSPGHSAGSLNFLFREDRILFTADSVPLKNDIPNYDNYHDLVSSLDAIRNNRDYDILLSSWTPPLSDSPKIAELISEGEEYIREIDSTVQECYTGSGTDDPCRCTVEKLGLPPFLATALVDRAFRSHLA